MIITKDFKSYTIFLTCKIVTGCLTPHSSHNADIPLFLAIAPNRIEFCVHLVFSDNVVESLEKLDSVKEEYCLENPELFSLTILLKRVVRLNVKEKDMTI